MFWLNQLTAGNSIKLWLNGWVYESPLDSNNTTRGWLINGFAWLIGAHKMLELGSNSGPMAAASTSQLPTGITWGKTPQLKVTPAYIFYS